MRFSAGLKRNRRGIVASLGLLALTGLTGCQVDVSGQTLPSPYWLSDDVQYFAPGTEFKLSREAAALQAAKAAEGSQGGGPPAAMPMGGPAPVPVAPAGPAVVP